MAAAGGGEEEDDDDVEKGVGEDDEDVPAMALGGRKKTKSKKGGKSAFLASKFGLLGEEGEDNEDVSVASSVTGGGDSDDAEDEPVVSFSGKKKPSKKNSKGGSSYSSSAFDALNDQDGDDGEVIHSDDEAAPVIAFTGKKKPSKGSKKGGSAFTASSFGALDEGQENEDNKDEDDEEDVVSITFSGKKKKSSKPSKMQSNSFSTAFLDEGEQVEEGKKDEDQDEDVAAITFSGKKKKSSKPSKKSANLFSAAFEADEDDSPVVEAPKAIDDSVDEDESLALSFSGKKKPSKKKGSNVPDVVEPQKPDVPPNDLAVSKKTEDARETSKNKKKKKKSGRTAQEEDDLDKILAELGEESSVSKPSEPLPEEDKASVQPDAVPPTEPAAEKEAEEESLESAAAKKKKKKKEKEKEKKAAAAAAAATVAVGDSKEEKLGEVKTETAGAKKVDAKGKAADKKLPKHVREMQEALARRKESEERKKREEEERLKKEEEERRRQEELERQAEEAKRRKKEREKEKLLKKKQEGRLLTGKQKEEARRLEAMRNQILANAAGSHISTGETGGAPTKRPKYQTKKSKPAQHQANGAAPVKEAQTVESEEIVQPPVIVADTVESENVEEVETMSVEEKSEVTDAAEENGMEEEDDEEWDAKSWDDINISVKSSFADEEADSDPEPVTKKGLKGAAPVSRTAAAAAAAAKSAVAPKKAIVSEPEKSQVVETRKSRPEAEVMEKNRGKGAAAVPEVAVSDATFNPSGHNLRSPICCIMGHVDTGKTKLLDCIRGTNVQEGEAGGITQQIGATFFPAENIRERTKELGDAKLHVPGLLVIDTPGHESFTNLRSRGSGLCDIAILVVDIMHGLEPQTIESLDLLRQKNTEFIVALNKVDRLYGWKTCRNSPIMKAMKEQNRDVQNEFNMRVTQIVTQFKEQGLNTELYYKNKEKGEVYSIVPTSAISGEGVPDMLLLLVLWTQKTMVEKLTFRDEIQCTVLEVKVVEGHGTTIDVVLVNGVLHEGDDIVVCGLQGPIVTNIRALLTPHPMKELRVKGTYLHHKEIRAAQGIKISAQGLEHAIAGTALYVKGPDDFLEDVKDLAMEDMKSVMSRTDRSGEGVCVQASTLGSLEALLEFLKSPAVSIPVSSISIGPVHKKDVMKASVMLEKKKEYAAILAFDVKVTPEARELADELGVKIFTADIIYHLFDQFKAYIDNIKEEKKKEAADEAVFPCVLRILPNCVFNKKDPIVLGVDVLEGIAKVGTPVCIPQREFIDIGRIASIENNHKPVDSAKKGQKVAMKIVGSNSEEQQKMFGRHFDMEDELVSHITRRSIDILKSNYRDDLSIEEWKLVVKLKNLFKIQ